MEVLFESFVGIELKRTTAHPWSLTLQAASEYLLTHQPEGSSAANQWFQLRPDILFSKGSERIIGDTKWKLIKSNENNRFSKYGLSQQDIYQMLAYGTKYLSSSGHMLLIYLKHECFKEPLPVFSFSEQLHLWIVPFCIETEKLHTEKLQKGSWSEKMSFDSDAKVGCIRL